PSKRKCTSATDVSIVTTICRPGEIERTAASSCNPSAPGKPDAKGANTSAIMACSASAGGRSAIGLTGRGSAGSGPALLPRLACRDAQAPGGSVQDAVDDFRLIIVEERVRDVDILVDDDAIGNVLAFDELECAGT